ncbi:MAG: hypothetical protein COS15_05230 [Caldiserica bacterium CG02_land_8_20_14_3_00_36_38]|nr:MAG: hypothetical protein COX13_02535 [Caldiserica bacterium CG23_combo_of_CG06-09_8_20_14_all_35_60]PIV54655.1 MAG: hypothetical protein COS15_05230 [Caldiserica bacterium CG02_land_8_20_14_3_00_36_38]
MSLQIFVYPNLADFFPLYSLILSCESFFIFYASFYGISLNKIEVLFGKNAKVPPMSKIVSSNPLKLSELWVSRKNTSPL